MSDVVTEMPLNKHSSWAGLEHEITPTEAFFCRNHNPFPEPPDAVDWAGHRLTVEDLAAMPQVEYVVTLECAGNGRTEFSPVPTGTPWGIRGMSTGKFRGVSLAALLERYPPGPEHHHLIFKGADLGKEGLYERSLTLSEVYRHSALLALEMNGEPLTIRHGAPVRLIVPEYYAMTSIKWLCQVVYSAEASRGYFQVEDYLVDYRDPEVPIRPATTMRPKSILTSPQQEQQVSGRVRIQGKAWSGEGEVSEVELVIAGPGGHKRSLMADLGERLGPFAWRSFTAEVVLEPGAYSVRSFCRAGEQVQPEQARWNAQGYENNSAHKVDFQVTA